jgi:hypothetical protein
MEQQRQQDVKKIVIQQSKSRTSEPKRNAGGCLIDSDSD